MELACDVLVVGGGCGGVAAAVAASDMGRRVILTEVTTWLGGQLTSQAVPPDEHPWVERTGVTAHYRLLRNAVRQRYKQTRRLTEAARQDPLVNPGQAWVSKIGAEPVIFHEVLNCSQLASGRLLAYATDRRAGGATCRFPSAGA
jgi:glycine/D-amino acid oxidase-like deaminating enzyme